MTLTNSEQLLLDTLKALPPNSIYVDVERKAVFKGFQLYTSGHTKSIGWERGKNKLVVVVEDKKVYDVSISLHDSGLAFQCQCRNYIPLGKCQHVVCALLAVVHALKPNLFKLNRENGIGRERLLAGLLGRRVDEDEGEPDDGKIIPLASYQRGVKTLPFMEHTGTSQGFQVVIEKNGHGLDYYVEVQGERAARSRGSQVLPPGLEYLRNISHQEEMSSPLLVFFRGWGNRYPVFYRDRNGLKLVRWKDDIPCETWTELDAAGSVIHLRKICTIGAEQSPAEIAGGFAVDIEGGRISHIADKQGWDPWETIRETCLKERRVSSRLKNDGALALSIPMELFETIHLVFDSPADRDELLPSLKLRINGKAAEPELVRASDYRILITRRIAGAKEFLVKHEPVVSGHVFAASRKIMLFVKAVEWGRLPVSVRTRKRKPLLYEAFFRTLAQQTKNRNNTDEELRESINETSFETPQCAALARSILREFLTEARLREISLHFRNGNWQLFDANMGKEARIFAMLYGVFGTRLFERVVNDIEMVVREDELLKHLNTLYGFAKEEGIPLYLDGCPVEQATWEFTLDATDGTIDWFEIRPEIRCKGQQIGKELWEQALAGKGVLHSDGSIHLLDEKTRQTLSALARFSKAGRTGSREIVSVPRLKIIDLFLLRKEGVIVKLSPQDEEVIARLTRFSTIEQKELPSGLRTELRPYQKEGYYWLSFLYEHGFGACLADDMGLGKTIQAICLLGAMKEAKVRRSAASPSPLSLIVVPPSLIFNWEQEIERFYPDLRVLIYRGKDRAIITEGIDVILTSYGLILRDIEKLKIVSFHAIVFDEAQTVKNIFAGATGAVRRLNGFFKVVLTGTPVENHMGEYFSIMDLVLPGLLGEYREFQGKAKRDISSFLPEVTERTKPFVLRRTKEHILKELPPKVEHDLYLELTDKQKAFYTRTVEEVRSTIDAAYSQKTASQAKIIALTAIMKLRQICLTPELLVSGFKDISPKIEFLINKLEELRVESHSALVFSQFTSFLDIVEEALVKKGVHIFRLDGSTPVTKRKDIVEGFQGCETPAVFLLSLKAGGQGLNLTRASYVFHLDPWWNPAVENQASDRSHRIGQKNKVIVTRLVMRHTVEEKMMALKQRKLALYRALLETPEKSAGKSVTREDFNFLLGENA